MNYPREHIRFYDWMNETFKQELDEYFADEDLRRFLSKLPGCVKTSLEKTPASSSVVVCISYYMHGGYYPRGAQRFANCLINAIGRKWWKSFN